MRRPVAYGDGAIARLPEVATSSGGRRVLLVTGRRSFEASGAADVLPALEAVGEVARWSDFRPNTDADDLAAGLQVMAGFAPDVVVAIGGGSAMDMAKLLCAYQRLDAREQVRSAIRTGDPVERRSPRLVAVPTTSGSGAEATRFAVVYIGDDKFSIAGPAMLPDAVVLDPTLATSGSVYQRATSGIDAVAQAIESLWATAATDRSRGFARHALRLLLPNIERFAIHGDPAPARAMAIGAHLAGRAIDISRTTAAHALSYGITKGYGISHGHAVALTLGAFIEIHADTDPSMLRPGVDPDQHHQVMTEILRRLGATDGAQARRRFTDLMARIGLEPSLAEAGVASEAQRETLAASVNAERLGNNPVAMSQEALQALLAEAP